MNPEPTRAERLRTATHSTHEALDRCIMAARPFADRDRYARFLRMQHAFHRDVAPIYAAETGMPGHDRLPAVTRDAAALGVDLDDAPTQAGAGLPLAESLGWLYVVEGSNLGAAFLFKEAQRMGLSESFGAGHLAGPPAGRAAHWRAFKDALNTAELTEAEEREVIAGATAAFARVRTLVRECLE